MKTYLFLIATLALAPLSCSQTSISQEPKVPKNIIIFIGDGMGYNHVDATSIFLHGETGNLVFEGPEWLKVAQATYPAIMKKEPQIVYATGYNPRAAWSDTAYLKKDYTDSGAAGTALSAGFKTYHGAIGIGPEGDTLKHISELAKDIGKAAGVITSVQLSHATPAAFTVHNVSRQNYEQIARAMILQSRLDVLMGCGHPMYDNDGKPVEMDYKYVGGSELWSQLNQDQASTKFLIGGKNYELADIDNDGMPDAWTLITDSLAFSDIALGKNVPKRLLGIPRVHTTLQESRSGDDVIFPYKQPLTPQLPTLEQMTTASLNVLGQDQDGFFLMVEGGAIDWAAHDNHPGRLIEEMEDFVNAVDVVVEWVEKYSNWDETLVLVTSDHETGMLWGEVDGTNVLTPLTNKGKGQLPGMRWHSGDHTNTLVPVFVRGKGSEIFSFLADEHDPVKGPFIQNTEVAKSVFLLWNDLRCR